MRGAFTDTHIRFILLVLIVTLLRCNTICTTELFALTVRQKTLKKIKLGNESSVLK